MIDASFTTDDIDALSTGTYTVTRRAKATFSAGRAVAGSTSTLSITAAVVPASGRDLLRLPEGRRATETRIVFTATQLVVGGQASSNEADLVNIDGATWEVQQIETFPGYYRAIVQAQA